MRTPVIFLIISAFLATALGPLPVQAQELPLPAPGTMVHLSPQFTPAYLKGIVIHPEDPLKFDFIIHKGDKPLTEAQKREEYTKLTKYFLASLAIPDENQWVNLSPYEKDRIIKDDFGKTEMGRDLLAQDYLLKQITASLIYPQDNLGKKFWDKVYSEAQKKFGTTNIPVNTFNKVWILPDDALIYEKGNTAYVLKNHLRVMLEEDYLSLQKHSAVSTVIPANAGIHNKNNPSSIASKIIKEIVLPELEREVNQGQNFAPLRQVYSGMLLAAWFKRTLKQSLLAQIYANKGKLQGLSTVIPAKAGIQNMEIESIYQQYLQAYKKGVFNFIKDDTDRLTKERIPRKYFSGGAVSYAMAAESLKTTQAIDSAQRSILEAGFRENQIERVTEAFKEIESALDMAMPTSFKSNRILGALINWDTDHHKPDPQSTREIGVLFQYIFGGIPSGLKISGRDEYIVNSVRDFEGMSSEGSIRDEMVTIARQFLGTKDISGYSGEAVLRSLIIQYIKKQTNTSETRTFFYGLNFK